MDWLLFFFELCIVGLGVTDTARHPSRVRRESWLRTKRHDLWISARNARDAELIVAVGSIDAVGQPFSIRRECRESERFPLAIVCRLNGGLRLGCAVDSEACE